MFSIGGLIIHGQLALAPMAGVSDIAFRSVCKELGACLTYTEMISAKALLYQDSKTKTLLARTDSDSPLAVQLFGSDPDIMADAAIKAVELSNCEIIDINMGCPTGKIVRNGEGCALMRDPALAARIIRSVVSAVSVPVTVKIRKGWDKGSVNAVEIALLAQDMGASAVAVHGRTRAQLYSGRADWDIIAAVKKALSIPVIANGDVFEPADALRIKNYTAADMIMIGRGSMGNPWIFGRAHAALHGLIVPPLPPLALRCDTAMRQLELSALHKGEHIACLEARRHYVWYLRGVAHSSYFKAKLTKADSLDDLRAITEGIKRELR